MNKIRVAELFAGVGGFRIGFENASDKFSVVWSNQWEPGTKAQHASEIYTKRFGEDNHSNEDIGKVKVSNIPEHNMLVGGFPCQDYSVARTLNQSQGIQGKKGILWWQIHRLINDSKKKPEFLLLENVDRLLVSPAKQRGKDFAIILASLSDLGYIVEWRVINAADYGMPQRRRRVFIMGYLKGSKLYKQAKKIKTEEWIHSKGTFAEAFKINDKKSINQDSFKIEGELWDITDNFNKEKKTSPFQNSGIIIDRQVFTSKVFPDYDGKRTTLKDILLPEEEVPKEFFINGDLKKWAYMKGSKKEKRYNKAQDFHYVYAEGSMVFPDNINSPSRTIVTGEGGATASRFKHVVKTESGKLRRLTPVELERLNMFPDNHTEGCSDVKRAFLMGNALVTGIVENIGKTLVSKLN